MKPNGTNPHAAYNAAMRKWLEAADSSLLWTPSGPAAFRSNTLTRHTGKPFGAVRVMQIRIVAPWGENDSHSFFLLN